MKKCGKLAVSVGVVAVSLVASQIARADFDSIGDPIPGHSWFQTFQAHGQAQATFDTISVTLGTGYTFETPGMLNFGKDASPSWHVSSFSANNLIATGNAANWVLWTFAFNGAVPGVHSPDVVLTLTASLGGKLVEEAIADFHHQSNGNWTWQVRAVPVPEASTLAAGGIAVAMLLFGFGVRSRRTKVLRIGK